MTQPRRYWADAEAKRGGCRVCAAWPAELAHVAGRRYDKPRECARCEGRGYTESGTTHPEDYEQHPCRFCEGTGRLATLYVHPDSVVPLCRGCHDRYDGRAQPRLDLLGHLTVGEEVRAIIDLGGLELARVRLAPSQYRGVSRATGEAA